MDKILDMIARWEPLGQGVFFLIVIGITLGTISEVWKHFVVLFRGWPQVEEADDAGDAA